MFQSWRFKLREVEGLLKTGRLEEALQMLRADGLLDFLPAKRLAERLALAFAERAKRRASARDFAAGWRDLEAAISLCDLPGCDVARRCLVDAAIAETDDLIRRGDLARAASQLDQLVTRAANHAGVQASRQVVRCLQSARSLSRYGKFADAEAQLDAALALRPDLKELQQLREDCRVNLERSRNLSEQLYQAMTDSDWQRVLGTADELLAISPELKLARQARQRAWERAGAKVDLYSAVRSHPWGVMEKLSDAEPEESSRATQPRFLLWVDGVGGYLVCLGDTVVLGQHLPTNRVDVPVLADISRKHVRIHRAGEGYVIEPLQSLRVNGKSRTGSTTLADGDEIELGDGVRFRFRRPHALSATARLDPISRHRTQPYSDGILLMAESCVLGPKWQNHVVCRDWSADVVLYRHDNELFCRSMGPIEIDGQLCDGRGRVRANSRVVGSDFSMCLEELDRCSSQPLV